MDTERERERERERDSNYNRHIYIYIYRERERERERERANTMDPERELTIVNTERANVMGSRNSTKRESNCNEQRE